MITKRLRLTLVLALAAALIAFAPLAQLGAQNAPRLPRRPIALDDILSFRALAGGSLSPNGQWFSYRLSPLQGDSDVVMQVDVRHAGMEVPGRRGRRRRATFSADSAWAAVTISPTRSRGAGQHARAPAEPEQRHARESGERREDDDHQDSDATAFAGEAGGWIAMHRYGATPAAGAGPPRPAPPGRRRGGGARRRRRAARHGAARHATSSCAI